MSSCGRLPASAEWQLLGARYENSPAMGLWGRRWGEGSLLPCKKCGHFGALGSHIEKLKWFLKKHKRNMQKSLKKIRCLQSKCPRVWDKASCALLRPTIRLSTAARTSPTPAHGVTHTRCFRLHGSIPIFSGWWLNQPIWKYVSSWIISISPGSGENIIFFETTTGA